MSTFDLEQSPTIGFTEGLLPVFWNIPPIKFTLWNAERRHEIVLETCPAASLSAKQFCIRNGRFHKSQSLDYSITESRLLSTTIFIVVVILQHRKIRGKHYATQIRLAVGLVFPSRIFFTILSVIITPPYAFL